jgi:hypothetical protein
MRALGVALAGVLALSAPVMAHSESLGSNVRQVTPAPAPGVVKVGNGNASNWHPAPSGGGGGWHPPHSGRSHSNGGWGPYGGPSVPTYWIYVPGSAVFDYPFSDWRGPHGGWGNP